MKTISKKVSAVSKKNFPLYIAFDEQLQNGNDDFQCFNFNSKKERDVFLKGFYHMKSFCDCELELACVDGDLNFDVVYFTSKKEYVSFVKIHKLHGEYYEGEGDE